MQTIQYEIQLSWIHLTKIVLSCEILSVMFLHIFKKKNYKYAMLVINDSNSHYSRQKQQSML